MWEKKQEGCSTTNQKKDEFWAIGRCRVLRDPVMRKRLVFVGGGVGDGEIWKETAQGLFWSLEVLSVM